MNINLEQAASVTFTAQTILPEDFWQTIFDQVPYLMVVFDHEGNLILANDEACRRLELNQAGDFTLPESLKPLKAGAYRLDMRGSRARTVTMPSPTDGNPLEFTLKHLPYADGLILATGHSAIQNEFKAAEAVLDETAATASELSRQVKGPLAGIELYASLIGEELEEAGDSSLSDLIEQIRFGVREVNEYLTSVQSMSQSLDLDILTHKLSDIVDEALGAMNGVFKSRDIGVLVTQKDISIQADRGLLVQLLLNILLNAVEAMPNGGRIFVELSTEKQGQVEIIITDTGAGVSLDKMRRIFSPFYTSKDQPLGLGLPVSLRIAQAHQGSLIVGSDLTMGARVVLSLPYMPENKEISSSIN